MFYLSVQLFSALESIGGKTQGAPEAHAQSGETLLLTKIHKVKQILPKGDLPS